MEINLRSNQFCNLSSVVARSDDTLVTLEEKVRIASILGTIQSTFTDFKYIRDEWKKNCEEERLLGVSLSGQMDSKIAQDPVAQDMLRKVAIFINEQYSFKLGINQSTAITCVKPEGTTSQLVDSSSGIHNRWSQYYIRRIRISATDPLFHLMQYSGVPAEPEVGQDPATASTWVIEFPVKAPDGAATRHSRTALQQLEYWKQVKLHWTEHNPSCTIYVRESEWPTVMAWVYENWKIVGGISFLPSEDHVYRLAPYEEISREEYEKRVAAFPQIDYNQLSQFEKDDQTTGARDYACTGNSCDL